MEENKGFVAFFKSNFDAISKLFLNHVAMCVFGMVVSLATKLLNDKVFTNPGEEPAPGFGVLGYVMCGVGILMYLCLIYVCMWEKGAADKIKIDGGRLNKNNARGILFWLIANSINIFMVLNLVIIANKEENLLALNDVCELSNPKYDAIMFTTVNRLKQLPLEQALFKFTSYGTATFKDNFRTLVPDNTIV